MTGRSRSALGIGLMVASAACFASLDTTTRYLGALLPIQLMLWSRYAVHAAVMAVWLGLTGRGQFRAANLRFQLLRGALLLGSSTLAFHGLQHMPVAEFTAIVMLTPVLVTVLAAWVLHERVSALRWALVCGGMAGALIVIRPGSGLFGWAVLMPLAAAFSNAAFQVLTSKHGRHESALTTNFYTGLTGTAILTPIVLTSHVDITGLLAAAPAQQLGLLLALGSFGTAGHLLLIMSLGRAGTATLMPFVYTQIAFAALVGWIVFRASPDFWGWVGMAVIAVCGAASAWLNIRERRQLQEPVVADTIAD
ncbi:MAG: DMT family transporter [Betaproteobacteria bacterium]|nr:MAG: DMT family transporter [Betaproteobacteria bacterium]